MTDISRDTLRSVVTPTAWQPIDRNARYAPGLYVIQYDNGTYFTVEETRDWSFFPVQTTGGTPVKLIRVDPPKTSNKSPMGFDWDATRNLK